jgi:hypothetical protein
MSAHDDHQFDRRGGDINVAGLSLRVKALEDRVERVELGQKQQSSELRANTALTRQIHEGLYGRQVPGLEPEPGVAGKVQDMHEIFAEVRGGLRFVGRVADAAAKVAKPFAFLGAMVAAGVVYWKTGEWKWPLW